MDLFLFPQSADQSNGFSQEVWRSYQRVKPKPEDYVVWYTDNHTFPAGRSQNDFFLPKISNFHWRRFYNLFRQRPTSSIFAKDLSFLKGKNFDRIHCDDVAMYPAVRDIFPDKHITVHFHNCFLRIIARNKIYKAPLGWKFRMDLYSIKEVEHQIFRDRNTDKIFICEEDMAYYRLMTGYQDGVVWSVDLDFASAEKNRKPLDFDNKLIWFGGLESHKMFSMKVFLKYVWSKVRHAVPDADFHLWGKNTQFLDFPEKGVFGHGFFEGDGFPLDGKGLYVNPDILGGGVKTKLKYYFDNGIPFLSTPFGFEGYPLHVIDNRYCQVAPMEEWAKILIGKLKQ